MRKKQKNMKKRWKSNKNKVKKIRWKSWLREESRPEVGLGSYNWVFAISSKYVHDVFSSLSHYNLEHSRSRSRSKSPSSKRRLISDSFLKNNVSNFSLVIYKGRKMRFIRKNSYGGLFSNVVLFVDSVHARDFKCNLNGILLPNAFRTQETYVYVVVI